VVGRGQTATDIARRFYGNARPETLRHLRAANPQLKDLDRITAGDTLRVPAGATGGHG
jgi:nucleoid-associated protein YgaU